MNLVPLDTFDQVAAHYAAVKPMRGAHKNDDVRPLGERSRKTERIVKMDDNTYLLTDAHYGDPVFSYWGSQSVAKFITREEQINLAPIVWRRHPDGRETMTVRNATGGWGQHNARYSFLHAFLPAGLRFCMNRNGDHYVTRTSQSLARGYRASSPAAYADKQYLSISTTVPQYVLDDTKATAKLSPNGWHGKLLKWMTSVDDGAALTYERKGDRQWEFVGGGRSRTVKLPRVMVNEKAPYKEKIAAFITYCALMRPLLTVNYEQGQKFIEEMRQWQSNTKNSWPIWRNLVAHMPTEIAREMIDPEHPMYLHFAYALMSAHMPYGLPTNEEDLANMKAGMNRWINKTLGFVTAVVEERK